MTWQLYIQETLPKLLDEAGVALPQAQLIVADAEGRGVDYAACGSAVRRALRVPLMDDVAAFMPTEAPVGARADVAVVVRNSLLEDAHAASTVSDRFLTKITYLAAGAFNVWLNRQRRPADDDHAEGVFGVVPTYRRAYAGLSALALAAESGGRQGYRMPEAVLPDLPQRGLDAEPDAGLTGPPVAGAQLRVKRSGLSELDEGLLTALESVSKGEMSFLFVTSLSRISRDSSQVATVLEFLLSRRASVLTTNFLLRPDEAFCRKGPLVPADSHAGLTAAMPTHGLSGVHAKLLRAAQAQLLG